MSKAINGNSTTNIDYQFEDTKPFAVNGYYRVMQIDKDGKLMYSNAVLLKGLKRGDVTLSVYPNPVKSILNMVITAPENNKATLTITDALARTVMQKTEQLLSGDNNVSINVAGLATGSYTIKAFYADRQTVVKKFVKQ